MKNLNCKRDASNCKQKTASKYKILPWRFRAAFLLPGAHTKSGWLEVDQELDMGCQLLTRTFGVLNCRGPNSRFALHGFNAPEFTVCALFFTLIHGLCAFCRPSWHLSRQPPFFAGPAYQFTVCSSQFTCPRAHVLNTRMSMTRFKVAKFWGLSKLAILVHQQF